MKILNAEYDFVVIIDCLSEKERRESNDSALLAKYLATEGVDQRYYYCGNKRTVLHVLDILVEESESGKAFPIVFISHGTTLSILIKHRNEDIEWQELRSKLFEINKYMKGNLFVLLACCYGFEGYKVDQRDSKEDVVFGIIGPRRKITPEESIQANELFFKGLLNNKDVKNAVRGINDSLKEEVYQAIAMQDNKII
jgi:hypothetical protein